MNPKFKAWDKIERKMRLVKSIKYADDGFAETTQAFLVDEKKYGESEYGYVNGESCELLEFSGKVLEDKTELYDGDLVEAEYVETLYQWAGNTQKEVAREKMLFKVEKRDGCFRLTNWGYTVWFHELFGLNGSIKASTDYCSDHTWNFDKTYYCFTNFKKVGTIFENPEILEEIK